MRLALDLHVHTSCSPDSGMAPEQALRAAARAGLDVVAVTDHFTLRGALAAREALRERADRAGGGPSVGARLPFPSVIAGAEYATEVGHVVGLFLREEIRLGAAGYGARWPAAEVVAAIHAQGGLAVWAHPFKRRRPGEPPLAELELIRRIGFDLVEVANPRALLAGRATANGEAERLARAAGLPASAGSDAHWPAEVGRGRLLLELPEGAPRDPDEEALRSLLLAAPRETALRPTLPLAEGRSQLLRAWRERAWGRLPRVLARAALAAVGSAPALLGLPPVPLPRRR
ncbi:MAG: PHP-associated domain-containing protein [Bacillota bacterium]|nr:PHP-associated domain-containing protein [Bacillota bacterium]